jgi:hypothetical protein
MLVLKAVPGQYVRPRMRRIFENLRVVRAVALRVRLFHQAETGTAPPLHSAICFRGQGDANGDFLGGSGRR